MPLVVDSALRAGGDAPTDEGGGVALSPGATTSRPSGRKPHAAAAMANFKLGELSDTVETIEYQWMDANEKIERMEDLLVSLQRLAQDLDIKARGCLGS